MTVPRRLLPVLLYALSSSADAQLKGVADSIPSIRLLELNPRTFQSHDTTYIYSGICKTLKITVLTGQATPPIQTKPVSRKPSITIHGNIQYDYLYRSFADTPFYQKDFRQHTVQTALTITVKDKYPFRLNLVLRKSNSPYFKNFLDGGLLFDRFNYYKNIKQQLLNRITAKLPDLDYLNAAKSLLDKEIEKFNALKAKLSNRNLAQELIEERERIYYQSLQMPATTLDKKIPQLDSLKNTLLTQVEEKKRELDSLRQNISRLKSQVDSIQNKMGATLAKARQAINKARNPGELLRVSGEFGIEEKKEKWEKLLGGLKTVGIGRSVLNYSELTARNVSLTGLNLEYNDRYYMAVAAGKVDYGFRDFFGRNNRSLSQHLLMARFGIGDIEKKALIFTLYTGKKANYGSVLSDTVSGDILVTGYSLEAIVKKDENTSFSAEIAKSTRPFSGIYSDNKELGSLFRFSDQSNIGLSVKAETMIEETNTRLSGMFRKTGQNFQSFSLFSYNTDQTAWMARAEQSFMKEKIMVTGTVRKNDFVNPFTEKTYKTSTVFGSMQLSVRIPKWPSLSIGYHPGSQLYIIDRNRVRENVYYILNGTTVYQYKLGRTRMLSSAMYNNYTTKGTDSGFINYSGTNYILSQSFYFRKLQVQGNFAFTDQQELRFYTAEGNLDFSPGNFFRLGAGLKYNQVLAGKTYWGGTTQLTIGNLRTGTLQLQYEKSFLPTIQQTLFPVEMGRLTWYKIF